MKAIITKYVADDGVEFTSEPACLRYEHRLQEIRDMVLETIGARWEGDNFTNGSGYVKHDLLRVSELARRIKEAAAREHPALGDCSMSYLGRYLSDGSSPFDKSLYQAWARYYCIDVNGLEWGQPYYALNPGTGTMKQLN